MQGNELISSRNRAFPLGLCDMVGHQQRQGRPVGRILREHEAYKVPPTEPVDGKTALVAHFGRRQQNFDIIGIQLLGFLQYCGGRPAVPVPFPDDPGTEQQIVLVGTVGGCKGIEKGICLEVLPALDQNARTHQEHAGIAGFRHEHLEHMRIGGIPIPGGEGGVGAQQADRNILGKACGKRAGNIEGCHPASFGDKRIDPRDTRRIAG